MMPDNSSPISHIRHVTTACGAVTRKKILILKYLAQDVFVVTTDLSRHIVPVVQISLSGIFKKSHTEIKSSSVLGRKKAKNTTVGIYELLHMVVVMLLQSC